MFLDIRQLAAWACAAALLGGCAVGQRYDYEKTSIPMPRVQGAGTVAVGVQDSRPYVLSGNKPASFVGLQRGGFGNPFDVNTASSRPLADEMVEAIRRALAQRGFQPSPVSLQGARSADAARATVAAAAGRRKVLVTLDEWKTDTMLRSELLFDVTLVVLDERGQELARKQLRGTEPIAPSPHTSAPEAFARKFEALFDDERVLGALK